MDSSRIAPGTYGVTFPHFAEHTSRNMILHAAQSAEAAGIDAVWFRDHAVYTAGNKWESRDLTFVDSVVALSAVAAVTERIALGTAAFIPQRHPIESARVLSGIDFLAGPGRLIVGWGLSGARKFDAIGLSDWDREAMWVEHIDIVRKLWSGDHVTYKGKYWQFEDVTMYPKPAEDLRRWWYCGGSLAAVRRAIQHAQGWGPSNIEHTVFRKRMRSMKRLAAENGKPLLSAVGIRAVVSPAATVEKAFERPMVRKYLAELTEAGRASGYDADGLIIAGPPEKIIDEIKRYHEEGATHFVFELRTHYEAWDECIRLMQNEILPELRKWRAGRSAAPAVGAAAP